MVVSALLGLPIPGTLAQSVAGQQAAPQRIDVSTLGPQVGDIVPDFSLQDSQGSVQTRDSIMGPNGAMIVFSRSMDWCPYCKTQSIGLQTQLSQLTAQGLGVAVITHDSPVVMADFARRRGITFPLLSDSGSETIKAYGILNTTVAADNNNYGIPFPGTLVVDRDGRVTQRFFEEAFQERQTVSTILLALGSGATPTAATRVESEHLDVTTYLSDETVAPGHLFSLVFDVTPADGFHVYPPGAADYRVISFTMDPNLIVTTRPMEYPESEIYFFEPLDERVPVFQQPFRLVQTMSVSASREMRAALEGVERVTISGTLEYQACDDLVCYNPQSVHVSHDIALRQLDTERTTVN
jgi:peroxiredoxin